MRDIDLLVGTLSAYQRKKLLENEHKPHWTQEREADLHLGLLDEMTELIEAIHTPGTTAEEIWCEAADVANYAAMYADVVSKRKAKEKDGTGLRTNWRGGASVFNQPFLRRGLAGIAARGRRLRAALLG